MTNPSIPVTPTQFINVLVTAIPELNPAGTVEYKTTFAPDSIRVREKDTVINYQLIAPTPSDVIFKSMTISPEHTHQLSTPSISTSGKLITISNANTVKELIHITLGFTNKDAVEFSVDPEVVNDPQPD